MSSGLIFDLQRFCTHDGPGIRTTVFLKGCTLDCAWCHNPEGKSPRPEVLYSSGVCILCGKCVELCPTAAHVIAGGTHSYFRDRCALSLHCTEACPSGALERAGRYAAVDEIMREVERDRVFYEESGGGLTLSGGEPMLQFEFARDLLRAAKGAGLNTCLETCGWAVPEQFAAVVPLVDLFLWDLKDTDPARHETNTAGDLGLVLHNLRMVDELGGRICLRCVLIPEVNLENAHLDGIARIYHQLHNPAGLELLAYHAFGESKLVRLGLEGVRRPWIAPTEEQMHQAARYLQDAWGITAGPASIPAAQR